MIGWTYPLYQLTIETKILFRPTQFTNWSRVNCARNIQDNENIDLVNEP